MERVSGNDESPSRDIGNSLQLTNWILYSVAMCHMTPQVQDFIPDSLEDRDRHIEFVDGHNNMAKKKGQVQIKM